MTTKQKIACELLSMARTLVSADIPKVGDTIDMTSQFGSDGKLYMPSRKFGVRLFVSWNDKSTFSGAEASKDRAVQVLEDWVADKKDNYGYVFTRPSGKVVQVRGPRL